MAEREIIEDAPQQEYSFNEGVQAVLTKIDELFASGKKNVVVAINGSSAHVGKTTLAQHIRRQQENSTPTLVLMNVEELTSPAYRATIQSKIEGQREHLSKSRDTLLVVIEQAYYGSQVNTPSESRILKTQLSHEVASSTNTDVRLSGIDFWVSICSPEHLFSIREGAVPLGDIVIMNKKAEDKPQNFRY